MTPHGAHREIDATLRSIGFKEVGPGKADYEGPIKVHGNAVDVRIEIPDARFVKRPTIHLKDRSQISVSVLAHVEDETGICYASAAGLPLDNTKPGEAILRVLKEAEKTLERSYAGGGSKEVADEYQHYWKPETTVRSMLSRTAIKPTSTASLFWAGQDQAGFIVLNEKAELRGYHAQSARQAHVVRCNGRIGAGTIIAPPSTLAALNDWWNGQAALSAAGWASTLKALCEEQVCFVWAENAFVGFELVLPPAIATGLKRKTIRKQAVQGMLARIGTVNIKRWTAVDCSFERVTQRNNPMMNGLADKKIALIGCGTIGSHLARMLVQSGAGSVKPLCLFDDDILSAGNIGRHLLGFNDIGKNKATALAAELRRFHPDADAKAFPENAIDHWSVLATYDLVIDATGDWNVQCALNDHFLARDAHSAVAAMLHCWVFMNGAGAQSFMNLGDDRACFRCLKPELAGSWRFPAAKDNDELELVAASCGDGTFVPFSVDASTIAASLANRAALDWANGKPGPRLRTVAVDLERGRYHKPISPDPAKNCPACQALRQAP